MSVNRHQPHVLVLPERRCQPPVGKRLSCLDPFFSRKIQVLEEAGGWIEVLNRFESDHVSNRDKTSLPYGLQTKASKNPTTSPDSDVLAQEIVVPRLVSLGTTPSQGIRPSRVLRRGVEDLEAALETIPRNRRRKRSIDAFNSIFARQALGSSLYF